MSKWEVLREMTDDLNARIPYLKVLEEMGDIEPSPEKILACKWLMDHEHYPHDPSFIDDLNSLTKLLEGQSNIGE